MRKSNPTLALAQAADCAPDPQPPGALDDELVERARRSPEAFATLYDHYLAQVYRYLYSKVASPVDAEDLTSQVFLSALESLPGYHHQGNFRAWLFGIARRKAADFYRKRVPQSPLEQADGLPGPAINPLAEVIHTESLRCLAALIAQLSEDEQELLRLRFAAQLSFGEIAEVMGRGESAVKMALYRLLERLEKQLEVAQ